MRFLSLLLCLTAIAAPTAEPLHSMLENLEKTNTTLKTAQENLKAERERLKQARAAFLPQINATAQTGLTNGEDSNKYRNANITLTQPLYAGGRDIAAYSSIEAEILTTEATYANTEQTQKLATINAYLGLLTAQTRKQQTTQFVQTLTQAQAAEQARFQSGESAKTDVMQATAVLEQGKAEDATATAQIAQFKSQLAAQNGGQETTTPLTWPQEPQIPQSLQDALKAAQNHPRIQAAKAQITAAQKAIDTAKGQFKPTLSAEAAANANSWSTTPNTQTLGLKLTLPLYAGGKNLSQYRQAKYRTQQAKYNAQSITENVIQEATTAYHNAQASAANLTALTAAKAAQSQATAGIKARYKEGESSLLDALDAEQDLLAAKTAATQAKQQHLQNAYALLAAIGKL